MLTTPQNVIDRARGLWYVSSSQYTDAKALEDYNIVRSELSNLIMQNVNEKYFTIPIVTEAVIDQNEYTLTDDTNEVDVNKVENVYIQYTATGDYIKAYKENRDRLPKDLSLYNETQSETNPFYFISLDSVYIYPASKEDVTNWVKLITSLTPQELLIWETDSDFPREYRHIIALWMLPYIYQRRGLINEANNAEAVYQNEITNMILALSDRVSVPQESMIPNLSYYE